MEKLIADLSLSAEEDDGLLLVPPEPDTRNISPQLCLVGRFLTDRLVNFGAMKNRMADIWQPVKGVTIKEVEGQRYLFQFYHVRDMDRTMDGGPWSFDNHLLLLQRVNSGEVPTQVPLNLVSFWVQIYDLPVGYMSESIGRQLGNSLGQFLDYDSTNNSGLWRSYMRIRVAIDVRRPLLRRKKISKPDGVGFLVHFKYERLASFCFVCGMLGHTERFCEVLFSSNEKDLKREWGVWLRAPDKRNQQMKSSKWLRELPELDTNNSGLDGDANSGQSSAPVNTRSETQLIPINFGNLGTNLGRNIIQHNNMLDTRDFPAECQIQNIQPDEVGEDIGLIISEDRKRRRANKQPEAQLGLMDVENDDHSSPPKEASDMQSRSNPHNSTNTSIISNGHFFIGGAWAPGPPTTMIVLSWNCRGLGHTRAVPNLRELVKTHRPHVVFLSETLVHSNKIEEIRISLGFEGAYSIDCEGRSGGIAVLWRYTNMCTILNYSRNHIDVTVTESGQEEWRLTGFYGFPETTRRRQSWALIRELAELSPLPWCMIGDFNDILNQYEKRGQILRPEWMIRGFRDVITECGLHDLPLKGHPFTWERRRGQLHSVEEQLDRAVVSSAWQNRFENASLLNLVASHSDHSPILLDTEPRNVHTSTWKFRFENRWLKESELPGVVSGNWNSYGNGDVITNLQNLSSNLSKWSRKLNKESRADIGKTKEQIEQLREKSDPISIAQVAELKEKLSHLLTQYEAFWKQRAKQFWLKDGDMNTKFFHSTATRRKERNCIRKLTDEGGVTYDETPDLNRIAHDYFDNLFKASETHYEPVVSHINPMVTEEDNQRLKEPFTRDEFRTALFQMHPDKSPGPDGYNPAFFQRFWHIVGEDVFRNSIEWLKNGVFPESLNDTIITLIPKGPNPTTMKDLRPISLCNVIYRIISKVLANRLKKVLSPLISNSQVAFVPERSITDNVIAAFEIIHHMKRKTRGKRGDVALKIDISKAYDRIDWGFLEQMLLRLGFLQEWVQMMKMCVTTVKYSIRVNDKLVGPIIPERGLRQGCPLSPYLFIICAQGLSALIDKAVARGTLHGIKICRGAPIISHLLFADDSFFFFRASQDECNTMKQLLLTYEHASGQAINLQKSGIFYSNNIDHELKDELSTILGVSNPLDTGRYLGLPSLVGSKKRAVFGYLRDRLWTRIQNWKKSSLSAAGRDVLIKSVAHALPTYCMNCFLLPSSLLDELQKMMNSFWWGSKSNGARGIHWMTWDRLCVQKEMGGLGYRNLEGYNLAMLAKQGWKCISAPDALSSRLLKAKYFPRNDFVNARLGPNPSFIWRSIWSSQAILAQGIRWKIGDGRSVNILHDPWLRDPGNFYIQTQLDEGQHLVTVSDLIDPVTSQWNFDVLQDSFQPRDIEEITKIPLVSPNSEDLRIWHFSRDGIYSVKSGYKLLMNTYTQPSYSCIASGTWAKLWQLEVPPKIKFFLWRVVKNCFPCRNNLQNRGLNVPIRCVLCGSGIENNWHLFIDCPYAQNCWNLTSLTHLVDECANASESFSQWFSQCLERCQPQAKPTLAMILWSIWRYRNDKLWNSVDRPARVNISLASDLLQQWNYARKMDQVPPTQMMPSPEEMRWHKPPSGFMKCNIDAAIFKEARKTGVAAIIRDSNGDFMISRMHNCYGILEVREAEAKALLDAILWVVSLDLQNVLFETDSKLVVDAITSNLADRSEFGSIVAACCSLLYQEPTYEVRFARRQANMAAHTLARAANSSASLFISYDSPVFISDILLQDCRNSDLN